jgi:acyl dehydratase
VSSAIFDRYFETMELGSRFASEPRTITEHDVLAFAELTGDRHPHHVDPAWARESRFGEQIAHGLLVLSFAAGMIPMNPDRLVALRAIRDAVIKRPTPIGTAIRTEGEIVRLRTIDRGNGLVSIAVKVLGPADQLLVRLILDVVWRRAP